MTIYKLKLRDIVKNYEITEQEFEYAGTKGIAELLGWQIVSFSKKDDPANTVAISFNQIDNSELIDIANSILEFIDVDVRFGDNIEVINRLYGVADFTDELYEDMIRYNYIISPQLLMVFGLKSNELSSLELVADENIIKQIISVRMN